MLAGGGTDSLRFLDPIACRLQPHRSKHPGSRVDRAPQTAEKEFEKRRFFELADRLTNATDPAQLRRIKD
jgi:hypothetical protein